MRALRIPLLFIANVALAQVASLNLGPNLVGDDFERVFRSAGERKSEFETTAQYEGRRGGAQLAGRHLTLVIDEQRQEVFEYDADTATMKATVPTSKVFFLLEPNHPRYQVIRVHNVDQRKDEYVGQNAYGAERRIQRQRSEAYGVVINQVFDPMLVFPLEPNTAREMKPYLRLGFACEVTRDTPLTNLTVHEPTFEDPYDLKILEHYVQVAVSEFFVFDARTGLAVLRFHPGDPLDIETQSQSRRKVYPLELQVIGSGLVSVQADGGREQMSYDNAIIRARQQIRLKLDSQYGQPSFLLNGSAYTPGWQIYNKSLGSVTLFGHAEALITPDSQKPLRVFGRHQVGETFSEWVLFIGIDPKDFCKANKAACKALGTIEETGNGVFNTYDSSGKTISWTFADHKVVGITPQ